MYSIYLTKYVKYFAKTAQSNPKTKTQLKTWQAQSRIMPTSATMSHAWPSSTRNPLLLQISHMLGTYSKDFDQLIEVINKHMPKL